MTSESLKQPLPWYMKVAGLMELSIPIFITVVLSPILVPIMIYRTIASAIGRSKFCRQMQAAGRYLNREELQERIGAQGGTIIVDSRSFGCVEHFAWWTPDDLLATAPDKPLTDDEVRQQIESNNWQFPWEEWCWENYVSPETGKAFLLTTKNGDRLAARLLKDFPDLSLANHQSGLVKMAHCFQSQETK